MPSAPVGNAVLLIALDAGVPQAVAAAEIAPGGSAGDIDTVRVFE